MGKIEIVAEYLIQEAKLKGTAKAITDIVDESNASLNNDDLTTTPVVYWSEFTDREKLLAINILNQSFS